MTVSVVYMGDLLVYIVLVSGVVAVVYRALIIEQDKKTGFKAQGFFESSECKAYLKNRGNH